jgi:hypothetical protein
MAIFGLFGYKGCATNGLGSCLSAVGGKQFDSQGLSFRHFRSRNGRPASFGFAGTRGVNSAIEGYAKNSFADSCQPCSTSVIVEAIYH